MQELIHGDCLEVLRRLPNASVDLICTDPPYGDNTGYGRQSRKIAGNENPLIGLLALAECYRLLKRDRAGFMFAGMRHVPLIDQFVRRYTEFRIKEWVVWDKELIGLGFGFRPQYEVVLALEKGKPRYNSRGFSNLVRVRRVSTKEHPHKKPERLVAALIAHATAPGDVVLDPFAGSGTTCVAAKTLGRGFIGIERDQVFLEVARKRLVGFESGLGAPDGAS